jgi:hypothetical protein
MKDSKFDKRFGANHYVAGTMVFVVIALVGTAFISISSINLAKRYLAIKQISASGNEMFSMTKDYKELFKTRKDLQSRLGKYSLLFDSSATFQSQMDQLIRLSSDNNLNVLKTEQGENSMSESSDSPQKIPLKLELGGRFVDLCRFLDRLENSPIPYIINSLEIRTSDAVKPTITVELDGVMEGTSR